MANRSHSCLDSAVTEERSSTRYEGRALGPAGAEALVVSGVCGVSQRWISGGFAERDL